MSNISRGRRSDWPTSLVCSSAMCQTMDFAAIGGTWRVRSLQFGVTNYINFAYGAYMALAAYLAWQFNQGIGLSFLVAALLAASGYSYDLFGTSDGGTGPRSSKPFAAVRGRSPKFDFVH